MDDMDLLLVGVGLGILLVVALGYCGFFLYWLGRRDEARDVLRAQQEK